ncbi:MAG: MaoC family dehydratase N-terminal domain-containing protein [Thermaerobacter sp.]|nr:MaoC family dehydratase N-terminal domain-containing protein [Thermaerobacter sp.]
MFSVDRSQIGRRSAPCETEIEKGALRRFAEALGVDNPLYYDLRAAQAAGFRNIPAPPTFGVTLPQNPVPGLVLPEAGLIHGEQEFCYGEPMVAGDTIGVSAWLEEAKSRRGARGNMTILTIMREATNQYGQIAFTARSVLVVMEELTP